MCEMHIHMHEPIQSRYSVGIAGAAMMSFNFTSGRVDAVLHTTRCGEETLSFEISGESCDQC